MLCIKLERINDQTMVDLLRYSVHKNMTAFVRNNERKIFMAA